jgi:hypothetical protein
MPSYTKLFNSIVTSTIWTEDDKTRIMWITMLAMADQHGEVNGSVPGMARLAGMTLECAQMAINKLMSPDKYSRTPDFEGRRIMEIPGGWELINHKKYRAMASKEDSKAATAQRVKRFRERNANVTHSNGDVTHSNATVTEGRDIAEAEAEAEAELELLEPPNPQGGKRPDSAFEVFWSHYPKKVGKQAAKRSFTDAKKNAKPQAIIEAATAYAAAVAKWPADQQRFVPNPQTWLNQGRWDDDPSSWKRTRPLLAHQKGDFTGMTEEESKAHMASIGADF